jgi:aspartyl-tRNA(Asn)/glutamyl-tRNA(Gln) amidotransferase subunit C
MVTEKDVTYVADLAHLELTNEERARMLKDLNSILGYIDRLNELDTSDVEPMAQVAGRSGERQNSERRNEDNNEANRFAYAMRPDERRPSLPHDEALRNAPATDGTFFKVPKVIER